MLAHIEQSVSQLSPAEKRVADWVLAHPREATDATLADIARECGTSQPTVIRFCRSVGLGGFRELALRLTEALSQPASFVHRDVEPGDATSDACAKVVDASIQSLMDLRGSLSSMDIDTAVTQLRSARQIAFIGLGGSGHVAADASHKFFRLGIPCFALTDLPSILQFCAIAGPQDVLVITSHSGGWQQLCDASAQAKAQGAFVVGLTDPYSAMASSVSLVLPCTGLEDTSVYTPMTSRLAQLALLDAVHVSLALAMGDDAVSNLKRSKQALSRTYSN